MNSLLIFTVLLPYLVFGDNNNTNNSYNQEDGLLTIKLINVLFRHGDRSPVISYPNDPHINYSWPGGLGALSQKGSLQLFNLGKNLHKRYKKLLPKNGLYSKDKIQVLSSSIERCVLSAASFLAGFMPPLDNNNLLPISWQPIPILQMPKNKDKLLFQHGACPKYDKIFKEILTNQHDVVKDLNKQHLELYSYLKKHTGMNVRNMMDTILIHNVLYIEQSAGLLLPNWTHNVFPEKMLPLVDRGFELFTETPFMKKIRGGPILTEFIKNIDQYKSGLTPDKTIFIYSGHDFNIINLCRILNCTDQTTLSIDYAATIVFELHQNNLFETDYEMKIMFYRNSEDESPKEINIPNCAAPCSFNNFKKSVQHLLVDNYDESCKL